MSDSESEDFDPYEDEGEFSEDEEDPAYQKFLEKYELGKTIGTFVTFYPPSFPSPPLPLRVFTLVCCAVRLVVASQW